jgi:hypothetical protein
VEWFIDLTPRKRAFVAGGLLVLSVAVTACITRWGRGSPADRALEEAFQEFPQVQRQAIAKFAGQVTVDGLTPGDLPERSALFIILQGKQQDQEAVPLFRQKCDAEGHFAFSTYVKDDGIAVGSYIVTFAKLHPKGNPRRLAFGPPDDLKNLYNDPDKNAQKPEFVIEVKAPGKTDYHFELAVDGQESIETPGLHALTSVAAW